MRILRKLFARQAPKPELNTRVVVRDSKGFTAEVTVADGARRQIRVQSINALFRA